MLKALSQVLNLRISEMLMSHLQEYSRKEGESVSRIARALLWMAEHEARRDPEKFADYVRQLDDLDCAFVGDIGNAVRLERELWTDDGIPEK